MSNWTPKLTVLKDQNGTIIQKTIQRTQDGPIELLDLQDPYATTEEVKAMLQPDTRTPEQKKQAALDDKNWRNEQGAEPTRPQQMTPEETLDWLAQQHFDQCREERPIQNWIRGMKAMLPKDVL